MGLGCGGVGLTIGGGGGGVGLGCGAWWDSINPTSMAVSMVVRTLGCAGMTCE